ncbi:tetratricopeptide repeat protein, partial [Streptomyces sp. NPDC056295]|uniref:tetratricopeptide repeat protein n=1 Tax=Streptomyces sp. NPDC056295 TaxID=3345774 RepID=UPI0035D54496
MRPRTVVWLNEAQHYLGDPVAGERVAAAVHALLTDTDRSPVLVLGTLWPVYEQRLTALPRQGQPDVHSRARELLAAGRTVTVPESFDAPGLSRARDLASAGDTLLADALARTGTTGRVTQDLAGAPVLLNRYERGTPAMRAVLQAAMDATRLGAGPLLPTAFLAEAAVDYIDEDEFHRLEPGWAAEALAELAREVHGKQAALRRAGARPERRPPGPASPSGATRRPDALDSPGPGTNPQLRLADFLDQHGRVERGLLCPPASFWYSAHEHLKSPQDLLELARSADARARRQWGRHLLRRAADLGDPTALLRLAGEVKDDREEAERLWREAADRGSPGALLQLARLRHEAGERQAAESLYRQAADSGSTQALRGLARLREEAGDTAGADLLYDRAVEAGDTVNLMVRAHHALNSGDRDAAAALYRRAAAAGNGHAVYELAEMLEDDGDTEAADALYARAAEAGHPFAVTVLALRLERSGRPQEAESLARRSHGIALSLLARERDRTGETEGAEALLRQVSE